MRNEKRIWLKAVSDPVPMESDPAHRRITKDTAVQVIKTSYYVRRMMDGSLVEVNAPTEESEG